MAAELVSDALWSLIGPLLPASAPKPQGGRPRDLAELASQVFCSYSEVEFRGGCCRSNWVAVLA